MANYGQKIGGYDPVDEQIYRACAFYFDNPDMFKVKDDEDSSYYMRKTSNLLNKCRYIMAIALKNEDPLGSSRKLSDLEWISLQTRTLPEQGKIPNFTYKPKRYGLAEIKIKRIHRDKNESIYEVDRLPLMIRLLHTKTDTEHQYQDEGVVGAALETFQTILYLKNN